MVFALSWPIASIGIAGFAFLAVSGWAMFRSSAPGAMAAPQALDTAASEIKESQAQMRRELEGVRADIANLRSQIGEVLRVLKEVN